MNVLLLFFVENLSNLKDPDSIMQRDSSVTVDETIYSQAQMLCFYTFYFNIKKVNLIIRTLS